MAVRSASMKVTAMVERERRGGGVVVVVEES